MTWLLVVVIFLVASAAAACLPFHGKGVNRETVSIPNFIPNPENDKVILVKGWNGVEIQKIINDFNETYKNDGYTSYTIKPLEQAENFFRLTFPKDIHPLLFTFLVNYVAYPFDLNFKNRSIIVGGKTTLNDAFEGIESSLVSKKAILYIPENDKDKNVVYMQTESGSIMANSFDELTLRKVNYSRLSNEVKNLVGGF